MIVPIVRVTIKLDRKRKNAPLEIISKKVVGKTELNDDYWGVLIPFLFGMTIDEIVENIRNLPNNILPCETESERKVI